MVRYIFSVEKLYYAVTEWNRVIKWTVEIQFHTKFFGLIFANVANICQILREIYAQTIYEI